MPKAFSEHEKTIIRQRLLDNGYKQFSAYGLKKTNIEEIAKASGISKGAFYGFFESKEDLFMDVIEETEIRVRRVLLEAIGLPGPSPRARLCKIFQKAMSLFSELPILKIFSGGDFELLFQRIPGKKLQDHLSSDQAFFEEVIGHCKEAGIPIQVSGEQIVSLFYPLVLSILHQEDFPQNQLGGNIYLLMELISAYCLGEVEIQLQDPENHSIN
jgi:AcrR family transcriptional regulator